MHRSTLVALVAVACGGCIPAPAADPATPGKPNVILCMTDDQGWGDTGYNGHPVLKTPELDAMAAAGIRFDRFFTAHPMCSPTRASCLTGRSPTRYRCMTWGHDLPLAEVTIAEAVRTAGYATGHFGKWHLGGIPEATGGTGQGLPESFDAAPRHPGNQGFDEWYSNGNTFDLGSAILYHGEERLVLPEKDTSDAVMDLALEWIGRQAEAGKPFLAVIWFSAPHGPHKAAPEYAAAYATAKKQADYLGELAGVDHAMGRLRRGLREMKVADDTMLWFCSDNGAGPGGSTGGLPGAKKFLSEGGNRVPGILEWPARIRRPFATTSPASGPAMAMSKSWRRSAREPSMPITAPSVPVSRIGIGIKNGSVAGMPWRRAAMKWPASWAVSTASTAAIYRRPRSQWASTADATPTSSTPNRSGCQPTAPAANVVRPVSR